MARHLNATIINEGDINTRRVKSVTFCARSIPHMLEHFRAGSLLVTSADRPDVLVAACLAAMNGVNRCPAADWRLRNWTRRISNYGGTCFRYRPGRYLW